MLYAVWYRAIGEDVMVCEIIRAQAVGNNHDLTELDYHELLTLEQLEAHVRLFTPILLYYQQKNANLYKTITVPPRELQVFNPYF